MVVHAHQDQIIDGQGWSSRVRRTAAATLIDTRLRCIYKISNACGKNGALGELDKRDGGDRNLIAFVILVGYYDIAVLCRCGSGPNCRQPVHRRDYRATPGYVVGGEGRRDCPFLVD